jgi:hypothetical protein
MEVLTEPCPCHPSEHRRIIVRHEAGDLIRACEYAMWCFERISSGAMESWGDDPEHSDPIYDVLTEAKIVFQKPPHDWNTNDD